MNEVTSLLPVASGAFYTGETFWTAAGVAGTVLVGFLAMWTAFRSTHPKRRLNYTVSHQPLVQPVMYGSLEIRWNGALLTDPHVVRLVLTNPGRWDIPSEAFDRGDPFQVDLGVPCLEVLRTEAGPARPVPRRRRCAVRSCASDPASSAAARRSPTSCSWTRHRRTTAGTPSST
ncbi:hypothetical protein WKI71_38790 [Streptomyces sp. MS1.AVA.1]|uniref:Uncharacterized protein n=1 Tax=Streptomyces machairae TaxID=3134109 RepID=A0ABU8UUY4_9ACTN